MAPLRRLVVFAVGLSVSASLTHAVVLFPLPPVAASDDTHGNRVQARSKINDGPLWCFEPTDPRMEPAKRYFDAGLTYACLRLGAFCDDAGTVRYPRINHDACYTRCICRTGPTPSDTNEERPLEAVSLIPAPKPHPEYVEAQHRFKEQADRLYSGLPPLTRTTTSSSSSTQEPPSQTDAVPTAEPVASQHADPPANPTPVDETKLDARCAGDCACGTKCTCSSDTPDEQHAPESQRL
ncbi:hypothetical protein SPI_07818 [Niveomyces insectorum RCEF 264]|uniref:Uncharacterized protein n=1 Tax=Niveomyces insectorum RCEF 264 TaxID=1081102 RepID=A0A167P256_9HYPO|nr:hypothetical protein SPI_07818 [Niveomyces insectorum RCEF 264]